MTTPQSQPLAAPFALGAVIFPASDSLLSQLGVQVSKEGTRCLGLVVEERTNKAKVYFPQLNMTVWLMHDEMRDVAQENQRQNPAFDSLNPQKNSSLARHPAWIAKWWIGELQPIEILDTQTDTMDAIWSRDDGELASHFQGNPSEWIFKLSLGIEELDMNQWKSLESLRRDDIAIARFLPAGMYKLEVQLFLKCSKT